MTTTHQHPDAPQGAAPEVEKRIPEILVELSLANKPKSNVIIDAIIPALPPSVNSLYPTGRGGRRYKSAEGKDFDRTVANELEYVYGPNPPAIPENVKLGFKVVCYYPHPGLFKNGKTKKDQLVECDSDNRLKAAKDALAVALGFDDKRIYTDMVSKVRGVAGLLRDYPKGYCRVTLSVIGDLP
jgi:Holliday junction resolvase RusA-like endonuclease